MSESLHNDQWENAALTSIIEHLGAQVLQYLVYFGDPLRQDT